MPRSSTLLNCKAFALALLFCACGALTASAQPARRPSQRQPRQPARQPARQQLPPSTVVSPAPPRAPAVVARESELVCSGAITQTSHAGLFEIVGAEEERERRVFGDGNMVYINAGAQQGVSVGQEFLIVRPRGRFRSQLSSKKGSLGVYTQEIGRLRVARVRDRVSVAEIVRSCDNVLVGDLLRPAQKRTAPVARTQGNLDRFAEPTGKQTGRIVLARESREVISRDQVVFIDLGAEDNLKVGDYLTIYRPLEFGTFVDYQEEKAQNTRRGFESDEFRGGKFSNQSQRLEDPDGSTGGPSVKTPDIRKRRPQVPRRVVGEMVVIGVEGRAATAVITRVAQEVFTGDYVEVQ